MISRQDSGRTNQKLRTRRAIVDAAAALMRSGRSPTVAEAAEHALVSRATAYRYFPTQVALLVELQADATQPSAEDVLADASDDPAERIECVSRTITRMVLADEALFRTQMRLSQELWLARNGDGDVPVREGRRLNWIEHALAPARATMKRAAYERLRRALVAVIGVEPVISLRDVGGFDAKTIEDTLAWTAANLVRASIV